MSATLHLQPRKPPTTLLAVPKPPRDPQFCLLDSAASGRSYRMTLSASMLAHAALVAAVVVIPLLLFDELAPPTNAVRAFFVAPPAVTPPPPPPPPPPAALARRPTQVVPTPPPVRESVFRAPVDVPAELPPDPGIDLTGGFGVEGGVEGGIEGGVAGGIVGGVLGGVDVAPVATPPPIRVGGNIKAPKLLRRVDPVYPQLAAHARQRGTVILEAYVDERGVVREVKVLRGVALLDDAALAAVRQWRYQPLLLNGVAMNFVVAVTVNFNLSGMAPQ
jgi:periplasmic protein TonB